MWLCDNISKEVGYNLTSILNMWLMWTWYLSALYSYVYYYACVYRPMENTRHTNETESSDARIDWLEIMVEVLTELVRQQQEQRQ